MCIVKLGELTYLIQTNMGCASEFFLHLVLVWLKVVPKMVWRGAKILLERQLFNMWASKLVCSLRGAVVLHLMLEGDNSDLLLSERVHWKTIHRMRKKRL